ncbi:MAG: hypothetical protein HY892_10955 [Deltaproteobacteria bacterium]|nr:hypothetical protein [Deltaproteobacteria bacterium]
MRCTQCGYTTFDYLEACPKCRADFHENRSRLNLPIGPLRPISLTEIMARIQAHPAGSTPSAEVSQAAEEKTATIKKPISTSPKTFDLDLSGDTAVENLTDKLMAKAGGSPGKKAGEPTLDLSLE